MDQIRYPDWQIGPSFHALENVLCELKSLHQNHVSSNTLVLVERFHITTYALFPHWRRLKDIDARLAAIGASNVTASLMHLVAPLIAPIGQIKIGL